MNRRLVVLLLIFSATTFAQTAKLPYPIIFLHGLVSSDATWAQAVTALGGGEKVFDVCLNHDGSNTTASLTNDISVIGWRDGNSTPSPNRLYVMNFDNTKFQAAGHSAHSFSNQAAIYKQGVALKAMIQAVLAIENTDKVILVGHSMGGLETREYLQRGYDGTGNGRGTNWVDQTSEYGHRVARVVSLGTPHLGSNHSGGFLATILNGADEKSDACRDLRYSSNPSTTPYLFGGNEASFVWNPEPYSKDVNCNGSALDNITALSSGTTYNSSMPLPLNIRYTWITSNYNGSNQDGLVDLARQSLYSGASITPQSADTLLLTINHIDEPNDVQAIIRGIDEPAQNTFAYELPIDQLVKGYITFGMNWNNNDKDVFKIVPDKNGNMEITLTNSTSGTDSLIVYKGITLVDKTVLVNGTNKLTVNNVEQNETYYATVIGTAGGTTWQHPYSLMISYLLSAPTPPIATEATSVTQTTFNANWGSVSGATGYYLDVANDLLFTSIVGGFNNKDVSNVTTYSVAGLAANATFYYRVRAYNTSGTSNSSNTITVNLLTDVENILGIPVEYKLYQNYPNPFNPATVISYQLPAACYVELKIYGLLGNEVALLINKQQEAGIYNTKFDASRLPSGIYFYRLTAGNFSSVKKLVLLK